MGLILLIVLLVLLFVVCPAGLSLYGYGPSGMVGRY